MRRNPGARTGRDACRIEERRFDAVRRREAAEPGAARARLPLNAGIRRISASLDLDTVLGEASGASAGPAPNRHEGAEPARILVADDNPRMPRPVRDALSDEGYEPVVTGNHLEIARILREEQPALAVLDLVLPGADGNGGAVQSRRDLEGAEAAFIELAGRLAPGTLCRLGAPESLVLDAAGAQSQI